MTPNGLHHVTAIAGTPQRNFDFYTRVLGLRFVKKTVNFDDPQTYHFYYGDAVGSPGSILTFFPWDGVRPGRPGLGTTQETAFGVPEGSLGFWTARLKAAGVAFDPLVRRFGAPVLTFADHDGMRLALIEQPDAGDTQTLWTTTEITADRAIRGIAGVTLLLGEAEPTAAILSDILGFTPAGREGTRQRFTTGDPGTGASVDLNAVGNFVPAHPGGGSVHHIAFRAADDSAQAAMVQKLMENHGIATTEQRDRAYFRSVYFREPGGILFEIATDIPGFAVDEAPDALGTVLKLPGFLEPRRGAIEAVLPKLA